ncbi:ribosomal-protein-alanine N-acetyltransferase [Oceanisphaera profunda]|uniref:[Ribosomal protein bS18]-alanine N-acetyltransferase n=1 Tax=Oceanisphaera profunda TaxID=1416627 RepID=A0A1Y0D637_9GAMM|nr:ribosomal protein S18-alanine N-acetyltransferase [Oceanisphaera profunda]ART83008.1 ribosomal-protein-alanine N-acetyltransferase [Oceanisphaera profunda]
MSLLFRALTPEDLDAMQHLEQSAHSHPWTRQTLASSFGQRYFTGSLWTADPAAGSEVESTLVGYFIADGVLDESTLMNICVAPAAQGQGLGRQLLDLYLAACAERGITQHWLEVRASNLKAQALYLSADYQEYSQRPDYYPTATGWEDAVLMAFKMYD